MIPDINLLPKVDQQVESSKIFYVIIGSIAIIIIGVLGWLYMMARGDVNELSSKESSLQSERDQLQIELQGLQNATVGSIDESLVFIERVSYPVSPLIDEVEGLLPEHTYTRSYEFSEESTIISVDFETLRDISNYVEQLENSPYFTDVQLGTVGTFELKGGTETVETDERTDFNEVPRYSTEITLIVNKSYLATGGVTE